MVRVVGVPKITGPSDVRPRTTLGLHQVYRGLDQVMGFGVSYPDNFESELLASMFNRNHVTQPEMSAKAREQSATVANSACHNDGVFGPLL